jgi:hypothetical protein
MVMPIFLNFGPANEYYFGLLNDIEFEEIVPFPYEEISNNRITVKYRNLGPNRIKFLPLFE